MASTTSIQDVMTTDLATCPGTATISDAARVMRDRDIGNVLVTGDGGRLAGIVTDRDLVVRCLADGASIDATLDQVCSGDIAALGPDSTIEDAISLMRDRSLRRIPVMDGETAIGIVTIGDLAVEREPDSVLGDISAAEPND